MSLVFLGTCSGDHRVLSQETGRKVAVFSEGGLYPHEALTRQRKESFAKLAPQYSFLTRENYFSFKKKKKLSHLLTSFLSTRGTMCS